jgi:leucyl aminopeptidase
MNATISLTTAQISGAEEVIIIPLFKGSRTLTGAAGRLDKICHSAISTYLDQGYFEGDEGKTYLIAHYAHHAPKHVMFLGLGDRKNLTPAKIARIAGNASLALKNHKLKSAHLILDGSPSGAGRETFVFYFVKGFLLAQYSFALKSETDKNKSSMQTLFIMCGKDKAKLNRVVKKAQIVSMHTEKVRDMVNAPANTLTPAKLAQEAKAIAKVNNIDCKVMSLKEIERRKMGAICGVGKGSREEPKLIVMQYNKERERLPLVCLVGKGVTFDSGGISLKSWEKMNEMKGDMAGGAVVINVLAAASNLKLPVRLVGIVPCVENLPGGSAYKPGDIVHTYAGKTIEVISTDAEGRLILSDALTYAKELDPSVIIDYATLTGACVIALGTRYAGAVGTGDKHINAFVQAGKLSDEPVWQLPFDDTFREEVKGDITDYKNYSGKEASTITAAALLAEFVGEVPWVHLDIAGTFWSNGGKISYQPKGGTGYGVDLTIRYLEKIASRRKRR